MGPALDNVCVENWKFHKDGIGRDKTYLLK